MADLRIFTDLLCLQPRLHKFFGQWWSVEPPILLIAKIVDATPELEPGSKLVKFDMVLFKDERSALVGQLLLFPLFGAMRHT